MMKEVKRTSMVLLAGLAGCSMFIKPIVHTKPMIQVDSVEDVVRLFPATTTDIKNWADRYKKELQEHITTFLAIPDDQRTRANTLKAFDEISDMSNFAIAGHTIAVTEMVHPDEAMRNTAHEVILDLQNFSIDQISNNVLVYKALQAYADNGAQKEQLTDAEKYFLKETLASFKRHGLGLPEKERAQAAQLNKEISALALEFERNIAQSNRFITATADELAGLDKDFIEQLKKDEQGRFIVGVDYPTYTAVLENCTVGETRRRLTLEFENRGYPENDKVLKTVIAKRDELAKLLGFKSYAHLDLDDSMVKTPERAHAFVEELIKKSQPKEQQEFERLTKELPAGIALTKEGKMQPWDRSFVVADYKKRHFNIDERDIAQYFPMEKTVSGLLDIYTKFLGIVFTKESISGLWHKDVELVAVRQKDDNKILAYLLLDLYPRENKYSHACQVGITSSTFIDGKPNIAVSLVIANFPKSTAEKPSLLRRSDVSTFFHEFGHALHAFFGRTPIASCSGTATKVDFVEMPSQMLEEWLYDYDILKGLSSHYQTGEPLSDETINKIIELKRFSSGAFVQRQMWLALLALDLYGPGAQKDPHAINQKLQQTIVRNAQPFEEGHFYANFGHLMGYGAKYYGYMWSKVFALDMFDAIKKEGLLNPVMGKKYITDVLAPGGSKDANDLLRTFLGREPNQDAFLKDLGL